MGASTHAESNLSGDTLSLLLLSYRQLVGQLNWNDCQNWVTTKEACAFNELSSPVVFPTDRPATMALLGRAATLGPVAALGTIMRMAVMLHSEASGRSKRPLSWGTAATYSTMHLSTEAQGTTAILTNVPHSSNNDSSVTTHTQSITNRVLSTAWSMWDAAANTANWILGRNCSTTANDIGCGAVTVTVKGSIFEVSDQ